MVKRPLTLMAVHAHPDDEASGGGVLARYAAEGIRTVLVTCTDGRCGDGPGGVKPGESGHDPQAVVVLRRAELEASCAALRVSHVELLGYADSGMMGWSSNDAPGSFWSTPVAAAAHRLVELLRRYSPDVVVTYEQNGFYGHPDHIQAHRVTMAALALTGVASKVYWMTSPHSDVIALGKVLRELGVDWEEARITEDDKPPPLGVPDDQITTRVDTRAYSRQKYNALAAHASQSENLVLLGMGQERFTELLGVETFVRVHDTTGARLPEDDLFAGLR